MKGFLFMFVFQDDFRAMLNRSTAGQLPARRGLPFRHEPRGRVIGDLSPMLYRVSPHELVVPDLCTRLLTVRVSSFADANKYLPSNLSTICLSLWTPLHLRYSYSPSNVLPIRAPHDLTTNH